VAPAIPPTQSPSPKPKPMVAFTGAGDHDKVCTGTYSYCQHENIPALANSIRQSLITAQRAAPHADKSQRYQLEHPRLGVAPNGESGVPASATSLMAEVMLSVCAIRKRDAVDKGLVMASQARRFTMNWFATSVAGHCNCQHESRKTRR
jgi:hypothetical protein